MISGKYLIAISDRYCDFDFIHDISSNQASVTVIDLNRDGKSTQIPYLSRSQNYLSKSKKY